MINASSDEFTIKRQGVVKELKDVKRSLVYLGITNGALMKVEKGKPHMEGKNELSISFVTILTEDDEKAR